MNIYEESLKFREEKRLKQWIKDEIIFAMANPTPEIFPEDAKRVVIKRGVATIK